MNEPEWSIENGEVTRAELQRFIAMLAAAGHQNSGKMVSTGSAALKWNSDVWPAVGNWWSDAALQAQFASTEAYLDFYQVHYYDWCQPWDYDPFDLTLPVSYWELDRPVLVGECPASDDSIYTMQEQIENAWANGYVGVMFWSYNSDWASNWATTAQRLRAFRDAHPEIVDYEPPGTDTDGDGLSDSDEAGWGTDPDNPDSDGDGMSDGDEVANGYDPLDADEDLDGVLDGLDDWDGDGVTNQDELAAGDFPGAPPLPQDGGCLPGTGRFPARELAAIALAVALGRRRLCASCRMGAGSTIAWTTTPPRTSRRGSWGRRRGSPCGTGNCCSPRGRASASASSTGRGERGWWS
jgi:hypothetical protein